MAEWMLGDYNAGAEENVPRDVSGTRETAVKLIEFKSLLRSLYAPSGNTTEKYFSSASRVTKREKKYFLAVRDSSAADAEAPSFLYERSLVSD